MIECALFGAGRIGQVHGLNLANNPEARCRYVIDNDFQAAERLAIQLHAEVVSAEKAFTDPDLQAVIIATPTNTHYTLAKAALLANKAVFCEKPVSFSLTALHELNTLARSRGLLFQVGFQRRFDSHFQRLKQQLMAQTIGDIASIHIISRDPAPPSLQYLQQAGGLLCDMTIHDFDMACWLLPTLPVALSVHGSARVSQVAKQINDIDLSMITLETAQGILCHIHNSRLCTAGYDQRIEVLGTGGVLVVNNPTKDTVTLMNETGCISSLGPNFFMDRYQAAYRAELLAFLHCFSTQTAPLVGLENAIHALTLAKTAEAAYRQQRAHPSTVEYSQTACV